MAGEGTWQNVEIPGAHVFARLSGRGRVLMDPGSALALELLGQALKHIRRSGLTAWPKPVLQLTLGEILRAAERLSDELDSRDGV